MLTTWSAFGVGRGPGAAPAWRSNWLAKFAHGYLVHGHHEIRDLIQMDDKLHLAVGDVVEIMGATGTPWGDFMQNLVIAKHGDEHRRMRDALKPFFKPRQIASHVGLIREVVTKLLDEWAPKGEFDFAQFSAMFPIAVMCGVLGVSSKAVVPLHQAIEDHFSSLTMNPEVKPLFLAAWDVLWGFVDDLVKDREASGVRDEDALLDTLIAAKNEGRIDETDLRFIILTLFNGGFDTSKNQLSMAMSLLLDRPEMYACCAEDMEFCGKVVRESLRHSSIASPFRQVARDFTYKGHTFRKDETLLMAPGLANRDPSVFAHPEVFDPERENGSRHVAFGRGVHLCIGQYLAVAQMQEGLHLIARRLRNPRLVGPREWRPFVGVWGPSSLPIAFDPA